MGLAAVKHLDGSVEFTHPATGLRTRARRGTLSAKAALEGDVDFLIRVHRESERTRLLVELQSDRSAGRRLLKRHLGERFSFEAAKGSVPS